MFFKILYTTLKSVVYDFAVHHFNYESEIDNRPLKTPIFSYYHPFGITIDILNTEPILN